MPPPTADAAPDAGDEPVLHCTDMGNAERLVRRYGGDIRYCHKWERWVIWDAQRWRVDENEAIVRRAKATVRDIYQDAAWLAERAAALPPDEEGSVLTAGKGERARLAGMAQALLEWAKKSESAPRIAAMIKLTQSEAGIPVSPDELDADPWLLNCQNGTLDLRTGTLRPHDRRDLLTKVTPVDYDPDAACPTWTAFLARIFAGNARLIEFIRRVCGYALTGDISEQKLFIGYGTGANGKSTFLEAMRAVLGDGYAQQADFTSFLAKDRDGPRNDLARLFGSRFVAAVEVEAGRRLSEVVIKQLTGGDRITARFLHKEFFEFTPAFKLFLACNHKPVIYGTDVAIWRRIRLIPFNVTIPAKEQDKQLPHKLRAELAGILAWAVRGCLDWQHNGLTEPPEVVEATAAYQAEMDILAGFLDECCVLAPRAKVQASDLYKAYTHYCAQVGEQALTQQTFGRRLTERGLRRDRSNKQWWYFGIGLRAPAGPDCDPSDPSDRSSGDLPPNAPREGDSSEKGSQGSQSGPAGASDIPPRPASGDADELRNRVYDLAERAGWPVLRLSPLMERPSSAEDWVAFINRSGATDLGVAQRSLELFLQAREEECSPCALCGAPLRSPVIQTSDGRLFCDAHDLWEIPPPKAAGEEGRERGAI